jgi:hypothetical protein
MGTHNAAELLESIRRQPAELLQPNLDVVEAVPGGTMRTESQPLNEAEQARLDANKAATVQSDYRTKQLSDERAKVSSFLGPIRPVSYDYKPGILAQGEGDPGRQYGLLAQDLARTPQGASVVERGDDGMLRVQVPQLVMMNTAADAEQQREIDTLKRKVRAT